MAPIDKSLTHGSQVVMRFSLQMVYQWTEELSIRTSGANRKASLTNGDVLPMVPLDNSTIELHLPVEAKEKLAIIFCGLYNAI